MDIQRLGSHQWGDRQRKSGEPSIKIILFRPSFVSQSVKMFKNSKCIVLIDVFKPGVVVKIDYSFQFKDFFQSLYHKIPKVMSNVSNIPLVRHS